MTDEERKVIELMMKDFEIEGTVEEFLQKSKELSEIEVNSKTEYCPVCNARWFSKEIPEEYHEYYSPPYFYSKLIGIYDSKLDSTVEYQCPECLTRFERDETHSTY